MLQLESREAALKHIGLKGKRCAEIGVFTGHFAAKIMEHDPAYLYLVDPWKPQEDYGDIINQDAEKFDNIYRNVCANFKQFDNVNIMRMTSREAVREFIGNHLPLIKGMRYAECGPLDFINIDADHSFGHCFHDLCAWSLCMRSGGIMLVHDFSGEIYYGVAQAVQYFCKVTGAEMVFETTDKPGSIGLKILH